MAIINGIKARAINGILLPDAQSTFDYAEDVSQESGIVENLNCVFDGLNRLQGTEGFMLIPSGYKTDFLIPQIPTKEGVEFGTWEDHFFDVDRASIKTRVNDKNIIVDVPIDTPSIDYSDATFTETDPESINIALHSEEMDDASWVKGQSGVALIPVVTANFATAPDGTVTADKVVFDLNSSVSPADRSDLTQTISTSNGETTSFWLKTITGTEIVTVYVGGGGTNKVITDQWVRYEVTGSASNAIAIATVGTISNDIVTILVWGGQLSPTNVLTRYVPTTTAIDGVPPLYDMEGCGVLLTEPQSTNLLLYSNDFTNAIWIDNPGGTGSSVLKEGNSTISPDGSLNADKLTFNLNGGTTDSDKSGIFQNYNPLDHTFSIYVKGEGVNIGKQISIRLINTWNLITLTNEWVRWDFQALDATTSAIIGLRGTHTTDDFVECYLYQAQAEDGDIPTTPIKTEGSTVTRLKDEITNGGTVNDFNSEEGVLYVEMAALSDGDVDKHISISDGTNDTRLYINYDNTTGDIQFVSFVSNVVEFNETVSGITKTDFNKIAFLYSQNKYQVYINSVKEKEQLSGNVPITNTYDIINLSNPLSGTPFYGKTKQIKVFKTALTDAELIKLTTP